MVILAVAVLCAGGLLFAQNRAKAKHCEAGLALMAAGDFEAAVPELEAAKGSGDSAQALATCRESLASYDSALAYIGARDYDAAIPALEAAPGCKDADTRLAACRAAVESYNAALPLMDSADFDAALPALEAARGYKDADARLALCRNAVESYNTALALIDAHNLSDAIPALEAALGYRDADGLIARCEELLALQVGDSYYFGHFEQDNDLANGPEAIEWQILKMEDNRILVISKYALYAMGYHNVNKNITWEDCALRAWLNGEFLNTAFTAEEQAQIPTVHVPPAESPKYHTDPGNATEDQIYLISIAELEEYFPTDADRELKPTAYAIAAGAETKPCNGNCWWWLRSPGICQAAAARVNCYGSLRNAGPPVTSYYSCVRPALWIELNLTST